jgi:hypothetical protein
MFYGLSRLCTFYGSLLIAFFGLSLMYGATEAMFNTESAGSLITPNLVLVEAMRPITEFVLSFAPGALFLGLFLMVLGTLTRPSRRLRGGSLREVATTPPAQAPLPAVDHAAIEARNKAEVIGWELAKPEELQTLSVSELQQRVDWRNMLSDGITELKVRLADPLLSKTSTNPDIVSRRQQLEAVLREAREAGVRYRLHLDDAYDKGLIERVRVNIRVILG